MRIEMLPVDLADDANTVAAITELVNDAYSTAERGLWTMDLPRTNVEEMASVIAADELIVARLDNGTVLGSAFTRMLDADTGWFGALSVDLAQAGKGVGGALVTGIERRARELGAKRVQLELIVPAVPHPHTDRLRTWYESLGYVEVDEIGLADIDASAIPYQTSPITFAVMHKPL
jgi:GNAT superfamily N-acetyltransferase